MTGVSGATVRRWEANLSVPDEDDIAAIAEVSRLSRMQAGFLSLAFSKAKAVPGPPEHQFKDYMSQLLANAGHPAIVYDSLLYQRAWNRLVDALRPNMCDGLGRGLHTIAMLLRARARRNDVEAETYMRQAIARFWITSAMVSHRPEYAKLLADLDREPNFRGYWLEFAFGEPEGVIEPLTDPDALVGRGASFRSYQATIHFPPQYYLYEYLPQDEEAAVRIESLKGNDGQSEVFFASRLHWVE